VKEAARGAVKGTPKVHVIRYADDMVVTGESRELLEEVVLPEIKQFLEARGLRVKPSKTRIVNMGEGFDSWDSTYGDKRPPAQSNRTAKVLIITHSRNNVDKEEN
jgi:hypothetical protein